MRNIKLFVLAYICFQVSLANNVLNNISFQSKENGIMVEFYLSNPMSADSINAWQSQSDWFYFTFYN